MVLRYMRRIFRIQERCFASECESGGSGKKGLVLGAYDGCNKGEFKMTPSALKFNETTGGKLGELLKGANIKLGKAQVFSNIHEEYGAVAVAGLGSEVAGVESLENIDECKENIRVAAGAGAMALQDRGIASILVEGFSNAECAAEGSTLGVWKYQELKNREHRSTTSKVELAPDEADRDGWQRGAVRADAQNIARLLEETPGNLMTPSKFAQKAIDILCPCGIQVDVRDRNWLEEKKMTSLLVMSKGSCEPPLLLELGNCGAIQVEEQPVVLTGKGITFDTGGLCLKACPGMAAHRAQVAGAAVVSGIFKAISMMNLPINVNGYVPLCENMIGGMAVKPGDVVVGLNGKTIRVDDTDNEGRVIAADSLVYSKHVKPCLIIHVGTMANGTTRALGSAPSAIWTKSPVLWREMERASSESGDRVWRLPLWKEFIKRCSNFVSVDMSNIGKGDVADPCVAAAFLQTFVPEKVGFIHLDITGSGMKSTGVAMPYLRKGLMTGRPVRTIVQFLYQMACPHDKGDDCGP